MTRGFERAEARMVTKIYGRQRALHRVTLDVKAGRVMGLLGPNGAGKTTLLWLFSTLSAPSSGTMHFGDLPPERAREARGHIGLLSHASLSYGDLTALENVTFFGHLYGAQDAEAEAHRLLVDFGLEDAMNRPAKTFSRGMMQRLGLARALVGKPSLVLLDEPFTGLDRHSTRTVIDRIHALQQGGAIVLMISHDMETTAELADEIAVLVRGKLAHRHEGRLSGDALRSCYADVVEGRVSAEVSA